MRRNFTKYSFVVLAVSLAICPMAFSTPSGPYNHPEIDPGMAVSAITLLAGSLAVLRIRRQK